VNVTAGQTTERVLPNVDALLACNTRATTERTASGSKQHGRHGLIPRTARRARRVQRFRTLQAIRPAALHLSTTHRISDVQGRCAERTARLDKAESPI